MATWTKIVTESSSGNIAQNAATATALGTAGTITFTGDVTGGTTPTYTGGGNLSIAMAYAINSVDGTHIALGSDAAGDTMYYNGTNYVRLAKGTAAQVLKMNSGATAPEWAADVDTGEVNQNAYSNFTVPAGTTAQAADSKTDTIAFTAAGGMTITGGADDTIEFSSADTNTQLDNAGVIGKVLTGFSSGSGTVVAADTILAAFGRLEGRVALNDAKVTNTDVDVSVANLKTALVSGFAGNAVQIGDSGDTVTMGQDLVVTGDLTVSGDTTTISTTTLQVEDKLIKLADVTSPTKATADGAGIQIESDGTEADWPELKWAKDQGGGHTSGAGTANGLTGWTISNMQTSNQVDVPIAVMDFKSDTGAPSNISGGIGSFSYNSNDTELYIRTA